MNKTSVLVKKLLQLTRNKRTHQTYVVKPIRFLQCRSIFKIHNRNVPRFVFVLMRLKMIIATIFDALKRYTINTGYRRARTYHDNPSKELLNDDNDTVATVTVVCVLSPTKPFARHNRIAQKSRYIRIVIIIIVLFSRPKCCINVRVYTIKAAASTTK